MRTLSAFLFMSLVVLATRCVVIPDREECDAGQVRWRCTILPTACHMAYINYTCASDVTEAIVKANKDAVFTLKLQDQNIVGTTCEQYTGPKSQPQSEPPASCDAAPSDNACVTCAKASCCSDYQACVEDGTCVCWVYCKTAGNTDEICSSQEQCGPANDFSASMVTCLFGSCQAQCAEPICG